MMRSKKKLITVSNLFLFNSRNLSLMIIYIIITHYKKKSMNKFSHQYSDCVLNDRYTSHTDTEDPDNFISVMKWKCLHPSQVVTKFPSPPQINLNIFQPGLPLPCYTIYCQTDGERGNKIYQYLSSSSPRRKSIVNNKKDPWEDDNKWC